eukprot:CAMPEP_0119368384 /NCGR_PEP_ID=MMETSP1334-20130426/15048_1 /TAXON_ID=127549 /ORGANISM="Calcidiscus leptoporus, Strain RCC1130" /LENGTH=38 /DNA_ID= /DNA_START= /DNA_END= /DNA_ORIENTATION=
MRAPTQGKDAHLLASQSAARGTLARLLPTAGEIVEPSR